MVDILLSQKATGIDVASAEWDNRVFTVESRHGATMKLARALREAGAPDAEWRAVDATTGAVRFTASCTLHGWGGLTIAEGQGAPRITEFWPGPAGS